MWTLSRTTCRQIAAGGIFLTFSAATALADGSNYQNNSQFGMNLPYAALPNGQDEIRTADGTSCRSAVGGDGTYLDSGVIGTPGGDGIDSSAAVYSRIVIPFGSKAKRLDCSKLYDLEIQRLRMELRLAQMGLAGNAASQNHAQGNTDWQKEGWSDVTPRPTSDQPEKQLATPVRKAKSAVKPPVEVINSIY
jgi:hypothetical protein